MCIAACIRTLTFGACARHFMYYSGRGGLACVFRPAFFFSTHNGGVYGFIIRPIPSARPRIHAHARNRCTSGVWFGACVESPSAANRTRARSFPLGLPAVPASISRACGTIKKYPSGVKINLTLGRAETNRPSGRAPLTWGNRNEWSRVREAEKSTKAVCEKSDVPDDVATEFLLYSLCNASLVRRYFAHIALV